MHTSAPPNVIHQTTERFPDRRSATVRGRAQQEARASPDGLRVVANWYTGRLASIGVSILESLGSSCGAG